MLQCYLLLFLVATIVFSCLITEVETLDTFNTNTSNLRNMKNTIDIMKDSNMENFNLDCLDQLIFVVHLPDVSVTNTNDCSYIL